MSFKQLLVGILVGVTSCLLLPFAPASASDKEDVKSDKVARADKDKVKACPYSEPVGHRSDGPRRPEVLGTTCKVRGGTCHRIKTKAEVPVVDWQSIRRGLRKWCWTTLNVRAQTLGVARHHLQSSRGDMPSHRRVCRRAVPQAG